uniref:Uncharacterized protein n=1 Tax=Leptobrachium leishanense TaxID=445787 RepID=A0A8C5P5Z4_9ANUR
MAPTPKKAKHEIPDKEVFLRLCDAFIRTDGNIICPIIKAETSIRVLYKLQKDLLIEALREVGQETNLIYKDIQFKTSSSKEIEGNIFVTCWSCESHVGEEKLNEYKMVLLSKLLSKKISVVKHILLDAVQDTRDIIPQPLISEHDFEMHKLLLCSARISEMSAESMERTDLFIAAENIKSELEELKDHYTRFALLSQNGKGKSFILNLLMLMTSDNEEEYRKNNENLKMPKVKDFIKSHKHQDFATSVMPHCHQFKDTKDEDAAMLSLSNIGEYFTHKKRLEIEPYILAQKEIDRSYDSTTKCIISLRYGTVYQMSVQHFSKQELQEQLFELVTLNDEDTTSNMNEDMNEKAQECLHQRFQILTGHEFPDDSQEAFESPEDIVFSKDVLEFAGKTELFFGKGQHAVGDRLALQAILKEFTAFQEEDENSIENYKKKIAAVKNIVIYLPSKILHGGKEILEMPGTDDSDPMAMDFIRNALESVDAVILVSEFSLKTAEKEVKDMLSNSGFLKRFKNTPVNYKLMLLNYPEKNLNFQFGKTDVTKVGKLEQEGIKKRIAELNIMKKILNLKMDSLPQSIEQSIITLHILPVLHTSILSQQGIEHNILTENHEFLKSTGIDSLIGHLDEYVASKHKSSFEEIQRQLFHFQQEIDDGIGLNDAKAIQHLLSNREYKNTFESRVNKSFEKLATTLKKDIEVALKIRVAKKVNEILTKNKETGKNKWNEDKKKVTSISVYNPYFYGKNPKPKVRLFNTFFEELEDENPSLSLFILKEINTCLEEYKEKAVSQCKQELNKLLQDIKGQREDAVSTEFVQNIIENPLTDALVWYYGKTRRPLNSKTIEKMFRESQRHSLRDYILEPNFKNNSVKLANAQTERNIDKCMQKVGDYFIVKLLDVHEYRWKLLSKKLFIPKGSYKMWQQLITHIKVVSKDKQRGNHKETISKLNYMMKVQLNL